MAKQSGDVVSISKKLKRETIHTSDWCISTFSALLDDPSTHDVTFKTSDGGSVSGHRAIVAAGSPVFHAMLYGNMKESNQKEVELPSVDTETFKALLSFLYTGKIEMDSENCFSILEAARYFGVAVLESKCADFIVALLNNENCCAITSFAYDKKFDALLEKCLTFMYSNAHKVIEEASFKSLPNELLLKFCQSSNLCVKEIRLFLAVIEWCQHQKANISEDTLKRVFQQIRYPLISVSDLLDKVRPTEFADSTLYTKALEFHLMSSRYDGPEMQLVRRKVSDFKIINLTTNTMTIKEDGPLVSITKTSISNGWNALCAMQTNLTELHPVNFKFVLKQSHGDRSGLQIVVRSCLERNLSVSHHSGGMDVNGFMIGEEVNGMIAMKGNTITTTIGRKTMTTTKQQDTIYLCVYSYYVNNSVSFLMGC